LPLPRRIEEKKAKSLITLLEKRVFQSRVESDFLQSSHCEDFSIIKGDD
jgi:hypothetical protein